MTLSKASKAGKHFAGAAVGALLLLSMGAAQAQLYKWVDAKGMTHYSDKPPPADAKPAPIRAAAAGGPEVALPYELAQAARNHPVVLYTAPDCDACNAGRTFLKQRGIPFAEKTVGNSEDQAKLKEAGGSTQVPLLLVGRNKKTGFDTGSWGTMLSNAAYPAESILPTAYQYPQAVAAAPVAAPPAKQARRDEAGADKPARKPAEPEKTAPPGFIF